MKKKPHSLSLAILAAILACGPALAAPTVEYNPTTDPVTDLGYTLNKDYEFASTTESFTGTNTTVTQVSSTNFTPSEGALRAIHTAPDPKIFSPSNLNEANAGSIMVEMEIYSSVTGPGNIFWQDNAGGFGGIRALTYTASANTATVVRATFNALDLVGQLKSFRIDPPGTTGASADIAYVRVYARALPVVPDLGFEYPEQGTNKFKLGNGLGTGTLVGSSWTFGTLPSGITSNNSDFAPPDAPGGVQAAILRTTNTINTTVSGFEAGVTYTLTLQAAGRTDTPNDFQVKLGGTALTFSGSTTIDPPTNSYATYTSAGFTTAGGALLLELKGLIGGDTTAFIDNIIFSLAAEAAAPSSELKITSVTKSETTVTVQFEGGVDGQSYDLNKSTTLDFSTPDIKASTTLSGTTTGMLEDTTAIEDKAFYRVEQQP